MDLDGQIRLGHLLFNDRKCRVCGEVKNLIDDFYRTHKDRGAVESSYSYECKECTLTRIKKLRKNKKKIDMWIYPDW
jgi:hypothetical protein